MTRKILILIALTSLLGCSKNQNIQGQEVKTADKNFDLISDFEKSKTIFRADTFELSDHSTDGGQLIAYHTKDRDYLVIDVWLFGETGKLHVTFWTDKEVNPIIVDQSEYDYDKPYYEEGYKTTVTREYFSFADKGFKYYNSDKKELADPDGEKEKMINELLVDLLKGIEIVK